ncbi:uncharacterized protein LOC100203334 isoform X2 [Hydra vulgaris]|uniref:uncharacterized protein LOC100203334 isoform X2 n=1 Tax=Hydra vulgaris TaxID=6087 RepID=UPI001F5F85D7|nr:uncharacterized protein LOC100203334 isoform X2 [Hydra vulgaris]
MKKIKNHCVSRVGGSKPKVATPEVVNKIEALKREKHDMFAWEIREKLIDSKLCPPSLCPSISSINRILRKRAAERAAERLATDNTFHKDKTTKIYPQIYENLKYMHNCYYPHQNNCINCMNYNFVNAGICAPPLLPISELRGEINNAQSKIRDIFQRDRQISKDDLQERIKQVYSCACLDCIEFRSEKALKLTPFYKNDSFYNMFSVQEFQANTSFQLGMNERKKARVAYTGSCFKQLEETYKYFHYSNLNKKDDQQKRNETRVYANT